jgi:ABC-2 type transport system ATP-binding protein
MLEVDSLTRRYGDRTVVDDVSFAVRPGRLTGFVGSNGAGKTTTMRMIMGILAPTSGRVLWQGEPLEEPTRRRFGYMPEERGLYPTMRLLDQLVFFARLHGIHTDEATRRARDLLDHFGLDDRRDDKLEQLSLGNQQRVQIAVALLHEPPALILDEPFSGLDPLAVDSMVELLGQRTGNEVPVLFSSHQLELVERLCDDLVILKDGRVAASGSTAQLRGQGPIRYRVAVDAPDVGWIHDLPGRTVRETAGAVALVDLHETTDPADVLDELQRKGRVVEFARVIEPLAHVFREVVR